MNEQQILPIFLSLLLAVVVLADGSSGVGDNEYGNSLLKSLLPMVKLTFPAAGVTSQLSDTVTLTANATRATKVEFYQDTTLIGTVNNPPWQLSYNTTAMEWEQHYYSAKAYNSHGSKKSVAVQVQVNNDHTPPTATMTAPTAGATVSDYFVIGATAADDTGGSGVASIAYYADGTGNPPLYAPDFGNGPTVDSYDIGANGTHSLVAVATDNAGNIAGSPFRGVTVSNPTMLEANEGFFTSPLNFGGYGGWQGGHGFEQLNLPYWWHDPYDYNNGYGGVMNGWFDDSGYSASYFPDGVNAWYAQRGLKGYYKAPGGYGSGPGVNLGSAALAAGQKKLTVNFWVNCDCYTWSDGKNVVVGFDDSTANFPSSDWLRIEIKGPFSSVNDDQNSGAWGDVVVSMRADGGYITTYNLTATSTSMSGGWHQVTVSMDCDNHIIELFVDGVRNDGTLEEGWYFDHFPEHLSCVTTGGYFDERPSSSWPYYPVGYVHDCPFDYDRVGIWWGRNIHTPESLTLYHDFGVSPAFPFYPTGYYP